MPKMLAKYLVLSLFTIYWLLASVSSDVNGMSSNDRIAVLLITASVLLIQGILMFLAAVLQKSDTKERNLNILLAVFAVLNLLASYLIFLFSFASKPFPYQIVLLLLAIALGYVLFSSIKGKWLERAALAIGATLATAQGTAFYIKLLPTSNDLSAYSSVISSTTVSEKIKIVEFTHKPNIYFISFDGMIPETIARMYMGISSLPYQDYLQAEGFFRFPNAFSNGPRTAPSFNRLLALDQNYYHSLQESGRHYDIYSGKVQSPLLHIFRANGYTTQLYLEVGHLGSTKGIYADGYNIYEDGYIFCSAHASTSFVGFFGYCLFRLIAQAREKLSGVRTTEEYSREFRQDFVDYVLEDLTHKLDASRPILALVHVGTPGHADNSYDHNAPKEAADFRNKNLERSTTEVPALMEQIVSFIQQNDPDAAIYIYSDHGATLSTRYNHSDMDGLSSEIQQFIIQDVYGILAAVYPSDFCSEYLRDSPEFTLFATNTKVARQIIRCLANGSDPFVVAPQFQLHAEKGGGVGFGYRGSISSSFENYLYE